MNQSARAARDHLSSVGWFGAHYVGGNYVRASGVLARVSTGPDVVSASTVQAVAARARRRERRPEIDVATILAWLFFGGIGLLLIAGVIRNGDLPLVIVAAVWNAGVAAAVTTALRPESRFSRLAGPAAVLAVVLFRIARAVYTAT